ncbi:TPA: hypothetical protein ROX87_004804 [Bacillus thuringiensis]|uniref:hypothetical protein n=1 Tax=Bacillus thuringiensis TaxID=1428 RepID=UPI000BF5F8B9|nr:hypothetical protein [Bacillus thuringiensis]PER40855.1 hypothetical protein CN472_28885 [Bacillus thuringiensis]HDX9535334.1 hypothetical protein [Bacillus thuringiensis]
MNNESKTNVKQENRESESQVKKIINSFKKRSYMLGLIVLFILFPIVLNFLIVNFEVPWRYVGEAKDWLSFFSSYAGGFAGAIATLIVVTIQLNNQKKMELEKEIRERKFKQLPALIYLENEMQKMVASLEEAYQQKVKFDSDEKAEKIIEKGGELEEVDLSQIAVSVTNKQYDVRLVSEKSYEYIATIENVLLHVRLIECFNFYREFSQAVTQDLESFTMEYKKAIKEFAIDKNEETTFKFVQMGQQRGKIVKEKSRVWKEFENKDMLKEFKSTLKELNNEFTLSMELKDNQTKGVS